MKTTKSINWTEDEIIESINLYNNNPYAIDTDPEVIEQSITFNELSSVPISERPENFRSVGSIIFKQLCWANLDPTNPRTGLEHMSNLDIELWNKYGKPSYNSTIAEAVKTARQNTKIENEKKDVATAIAKEIATRPSFKKTMFGINLG